MEKLCNKVSRTPDVSLTTLATLCTVTLLLSQTQLKISKEPNNDPYPPSIQNKDYWFLYSFGGENGFKCAVKVFIIVSSPILWLASTGLLLLGHVKSNPYFFMPWMFLTMKGLLLVQTENILAILRDVIESQTSVYLGPESLKWMFFYTTIFLIALLEVVSFYEVFDLFLVLWNDQNADHVKPDEKVDVTKREIVDIIESLSKCSLGSLSRFSIGSMTDSEAFVDDGRDGKVET